MGQQQILTSELWEPVNNSVYGVVFFCVFVPCFSRCLWWKGGGVVQILLSRWHMKLLNRPPGFILFTYVLQTKKRSRGLLLQCHLQPRGGTLVMTVPHDDLLPSHLQLSLQQPPAYQEEPMQVGRVRLTPKEWQCCLRKGWCIYCSKMGHFLATYPVKDKADQLGSLTSSSSPNSFRLLTRGLPITPSQTLSHPVVVDSGADEIFMDWGWLGDLA